MSNQQTNESENKKPYIKIQFNINSQNVTNNNILSGKQSQNSVESENIKKNNSSNKNQKPLIFPSSKPKQDSKGKDHTPKNQNQKSGKNFSQKRKKNSRSGQFPKKRNKKKSNNSMQTSVNWQLTNKSEKDIQKVKIEGRKNLVKSEIMTGHKTRFQEGKKSVLKKGKQKPHKQNLRETLLKMMLNDYENGKISSENLRLAIQSLITEELGINTKKKSVSQTHTKTQTKSQRMSLNCSVHPSYTASLKNTPKTKPSKSHSQKAYVNCQSHFANYKNTNIPEYSERTIKKKQFVNKIVIKGINTSLFLSKDLSLPDQDSFIQSPQQQPFYVINTSDSVRDLNKKINSIRGIAQKHQQRINWTNKDFMAFKIQKAWKKYKTSKILSEILKFLDKRQPKSYLHDFEYEIESPSHSNLNFKKKPIFQSIQNSDLQQSSLAQGYKQQQVRSQSNDNQFKQSGQNHTMAIKQKQKVVQKSETRFYPQVCEEGLSNTYLSSELSTPLSGKYITQQSNRIKSVKNREIQKWDQVMEYIKFNIQHSQTNDEGSPQQCLQNLFQYFQNQKKSVEDELSIYHKYQIIKSESQKIETVYEQANFQKNKIKKVLPNKVVDLYPKDQPIIEKKRSERLLSESSQKSLNSISSNTKSKGIQQLNLDYLQTGLKIRFNSLMQKKQKEMNLVTQNFINDKITASQYQEEKFIIQKWFKIQLKELKQTRNALKTGYTLTRNAINKQKIEEEYEEQSLKKKNKMIKCISEKYLKKTDTAQNSKTKPQTFIENLQKQVTKDQLIYSDVFEATKFNYQTINVQSKRELEEDGSSVQQLQSPLQKISKQRSNYDSERCKRQPDETVFVANQQMICSAEYGKWYRPEEDQLQIQDFLIGKQIPELSDLGEEGQNQNQITSNIVINKKLNELQPQQLHSPEKSKFYDQDISKQLQDYHKKNNHSQHSSISSSEQALIIDNTINENLKKLRYLTEQDKDDIFEFMFLDLCLQLFLEQTKDSKIMRGIEKYILWLRKRKNLPKGFKTNLQNCRSYLSNFTQFIKGNYFDVLNRLQCPMGPTAKQMLKFMRDYQGSEPSQNLQQSISLILPINIYQSYQSEPVNKLLLQRYYDDQQKQKSRVSFLNSLNHIHNKAMFDSLNESLDLQRNYGIWGKPFPWKKALSVDKQLTQEQKNNRLKHAIDKVMQNISYICGVLVDKEDSVFGSNKVSQDYLQHIREDRMSKMLSNQMLDNEDRWIFYDDQETQVLIQVSKSTIQRIFQQAVQQMLSLGLK